ncbi:MAG: viroplasmin family protein [Lactococcus petauri]
MPKYYAIRNGRKTGIFEIWSIAEKQVKGFPGAQYKSFTSKEDAENYLSPKSVQTNENSDWQAYVDGSFNKVKQQYGSGIVIIEKGLVKKEISLSGKNRDFLESYQIAGEIEGALEAMRWGINNSISDISIFYDYQGIESWALGEWKANKAISKYYIKEFQKLSSKIRVNFVKVAAHTGDKYNDRADELAKKGANSEIVLENSLDYEENQFQYIDNPRTKPVLNLFFSNHIITEEMILKALKNKWISNKRKWVEIKNFKTFVDISQANIKFEIYLKSGEIEGLNITFKELSNGQ